MPTFDPVWRPVKVGHVAATSQTVAMADSAGTWIDPWPTGNFGIPLEEGRRIARCLFYYREEPTDNGYARPIEGVLATVDMARGEVLEVVDYGVVPIPEERGSYYPEDNEPRRTDRVGGA